MSLLDKFTKKNKVETRPEIKKEVKKEKKAALPAEALAKADWIYRIIKEPRVTEKATALAERGKYVFNVYPKANKSEIKKAVQALYHVKVKGVNLIHTPAKKRRIGRSEGYRQGLKKGFKKAVITLAAGEKMEAISR